MRSRYGTPSEANHQPAYPGNGIVFHAARSPRRKRGLRRAVTVVLLAAAMAGAAAVIASNWSALGQLHLVGPQLPGLSLTESVPPAA